MDAKKVNGSGNGSNTANEWRVKGGLAEMLKGGGIMDVTNAEEARIAEKAGACAGMGRGRGPSDICKGGGGGRKGALKRDPEIIENGNIPGSAKGGHGDILE